MTEYNIRFATQEDIGAIMSFIDANWRKNHILSRDKKLFEWQYIDDNNVNMVIGEDMEGEIQAILGYIPYSSGKEKDISLALWKAKEGTNFLGVKLLLFLLEKIPHRNVFCNGINMETTAIIYQRLGMKTGDLKQWYRLGNKKDYKIARIVDRRLPDINKQVNVKLERIKDIDTLLKNLNEKMFDTHMVPFKSMFYVAKRYFEHPLYEYLIYMICVNEEKGDTAIVFRIQEYNSSKVLRLIDVIGDYSKLACITDEIDKLVKQFGAEYVDMYEVGLDDTMLYKSGWLKVGENENIIPNYFAPYTQQNVTIHMCSKNEQIVLFKGDGDQDRPN